MWRVAYRGPVNYLCQYQYEVPEIAIFKSIVNLLQLSLRDVRQVSSSNFNLIIFNTNLSLRRRLSLVAIKVFMKLSNLWRVATDSLIAIVLEIMALNEGMRNSLKPVSLITCVFDYFPPGPDWETSQLSTSSAPDDCDWPGLAKWSCKGLLQKYPPKVQSARSPTAWRGFICLLLRDLDGSRQKQN